MEHPLSQIKGWYARLNASGVVRYANFKNCDHCTGDGLMNCRGAKECFWTFDVEDSKFVLSEHSHHCYDGIGGTAERTYEFSRTGFGTNNIFAVDTIESNFTFYCRSCYFCNHCFGCIGLRHKEYCIFNKQYTKETYDEQVAKIIEHMQKS